MSACILQVPLRVQTAYEPLPAGGGRRAQSRKGKKLSEAEGRTIHTTCHPGHIGMRQWRLGGGERLIDPSGGQGRGREARQSGGGERVTDPSRGRGRGKKTKQAGGEGVRSLEKGEATQHAASSCARRRRMARAFSRGAGGARHEPGQGRARNASAFHTFMASTPQPPPEASATSGKNCIPCVHLCSGDCVCAPRSSGSRFGSEHIAEAVVTLAAVTSAGASAGVIPKPVSDAVAQRAEAVRRGNRQTQTKPEKDAKKGGVDVKPERLRRTSM